MKRITRPFDPDKPVYVYRNLNAGRGNKIYSVMQNGQVVRHVTAIMLKNVTFVVRKKTWEKVFKTGKKAVHAFAKGTVVGLTSSERGGNRFGKRPIALVYNPRVSQHFRTEFDHNVIAAGEVVLNKFGMTAAYVHTVDYYKGPAGGR